MKQRLILHIGTHKTGSTSLQTWLHFNRLWLRPMGLYYPRAVRPRAFRGLKHGDLRLAAMSEGRPKTNAPHSATGPFDALLESYVARIRDVGAPLNVLSCEGWSIRENHHAPRLARLIEHFDVQVVAFFRRPDHWITSLYLHRLRQSEHRETRDFDTFLKASQQQQYLTRRREIFGWWAEAFGQAAVSVIPYEPARPGFGLVSRFLDVIDAPNGLLRKLPLQNWYRNRSLTPVEAEAVRLRNLGEPPRPASRLAVLTEVERDQILTSAAADMQSICERYVRDGRQEMFPVPPETS